jgi:hypothetical protein
MILWFFVGFVIGAAAYTGAWFFSTLASAGASAAHLQTLKQTAWMLDMIATGKAGIVTYVLLKMAHTPAGRQAIAAIHHTVSLMAPYALSGDALRAMLTLQDLTRGLF